MRHEGTVGPEEYQGELLKEVAAKHCELNLLNARG
jgi:hypothetical protein